VTEFIENAGLSKGLVKHCLIVHTMFQRNLDAQVDLAPNPSI
jgi:hypothetical protein